MSLDEFDPCDIPRTRRSMNCLDDTCGGCPSCLAAQALVCEACDDAEAYVIHHMPRPMTDAERERFRAIVANELRLHPLPLLRKANPCTI